MVGFDWQESRRACADAAGWFQATTAEVGDRWDEPGLGEWNVRALVGHTARALLTVEAYLGTPAATADVTSAVGYYLATKAIAAGPGVAQRGRDAGEALGADPVAAVAEIVARVFALVDGLTGEELPTTIAGGIRLADYLPTRILELTVHTADLSMALGLSPEPPALPAGLTLRLLAELAVTEGRAGPLLLAATGRGGLPSGYTVL
ncbi:maleylpyruvate isomerase N-terminal domain-containing protein [Propionicimonas sp.]|uniref:maleylpyruvate isomerase N-terminal domain-containing protein n=1 Tax=Propionicimonas sp. TaxID=1955623 RepID=UPI0039E42455